MLSEQSRRRRLFGNARVTRICCRDKQASGCAASGNTQLVSRAAAQSPLERAQPPQASGGRRQIGGYRQVGAGDFSMTLFRYAMGLFLLRRRRDCAIGLMRAIFRFRSIYAAAAAVSSICQHRTIGHILILGFPEGRRHFLLCFIADAATDAERVGLLLADY